jgi:hypothetical protein
MTRRDPDDVLEPSEAELALHTAETERVRDRMPLNVKLRTTQFSPRLRTLAVTTLQRLSRSPRNAPPDVAI